jgi:ATP/maltotriose-dependent transcriptional regulator MalT
LRTSRSPKSWIARLTDELESAEAIAELEDVVQRLPEHIRIVLSTRRDSHLRLDRRRVHGELTDTVLIRVTTGRRDARSPIATR